MKNFTVLFFFLGVLSISAQNKVGERVRELISQKTEFRPVSVLTATAQIPDSEIDKVVSDATFATLNTAQINAIAANGYEYIEAAFPYQGEIINVQLYKVNVFAEGFHVDTDKSTSIPYQKGAHYRGIIKGDFTSVAALNFFNNEMNGVVSAEALGNIVLGKLDKPGNVSDYIIYSDAKMKIFNEFNCSVKEEATHNHDDEGENVSREAMSTKCVTMYFEIDYNLYTNNGSSTTTTTNWMTSVFNNVQTLFANDGITTSLKSMFIWTTDDPYEGDGSSDYLYQFNELRPVFDGDLGQLVGIDPGGLGGVAVTINGLCSQNNFSYSDVNFSYSTVPTYSWTIQVITHEMGHLLGSRHTHSCTWNGNNTAIDNCGPSAIGSTAEGYSCISSPPIIPSAATKGTIMSYCHLVSGVGISFTNGFGPQPSAALLAAVNNGTCLSTDCINTCINTIADISATNITNTTATISWAELGSETTWQITVMPFASNFPNWITMNSESYNAINLLPNTYYKARIRPTCGAGLTSTYRQVVFATTADWCNGITIADTGGAANDYTDMQDYTRVLIPNLPNKKITLTFSAFDLEVDYDYLYVYDGASTSSTDLSGGGFTGTAVPGPFVSTSPDGALTVRFFSDQGVVEAGYVATVGCEENLSIAGFEDIDFTYYPNPANGFVNIISKTEITEVIVFNIQGQLLHQSKINDLETQVDISAFATGTYFFKLRFDGKEANFKILKN